MRIIIVGAGEVGRSIAHHLVQAGHQLVMIDPDPVRLERLAEGMDIQTVVGIGCRPRDLSAAGAQHADMLLAVTRFDEVNMVACQIGYSLFKIPKKIARVRDASYLELQGSTLYTSENMPVDVIISPEQEVADAIARTMSIPGTFDVYPMADGRLFLLGIKVGEKSFLRKVKLAQWPQLQVPFRALVLIRDGRVLLPTRADHLELGDELYLLTTVGDIPTTLEFLDKTEPPLRSVMLLGGGNVGFALAKQLEHQGIHVRIVEQQRERAIELADLLDYATVLHGDALDQSLLMQENLAQMDACLAVTSSDSANIIATIQAKQLGVHNALTLIHNPDYIPIGEAIGLEKIISPQEVTVSRILRTIRKGSVYDVHSIRDGKGEVLEVELPATSAYCGTPVADLRLPAGAKLGAVVHKNGEVAFPSNNFALRSGDRLIFFATTNAIPAMELLLDIGT